MDECEFCNGKWKENKVDVRTTCADDNTCEGKECRNCNGCSTENQYFTIQIVNKNKLQLTYRKDLEDLIISPISEGKLINYCPICGKKL